MVDITSHNLSLNDHDYICSVTELAALVSGSCIRVWICNATHKFEEKWEPIVNDT